MRRASRSGGDDLQLIQRWAEGICIDRAPAVPGEVTAWNRLGWVFAEPAND